jgi:putative tryptophan/tyrosine transport system permease protein
VRFYCTLSLEEGEDRGGGPRLSTVALLGSVELGLIYGLVALGVYLSFRVLSFPDLTVDGSFPLGAAVAATAIAGGLGPWPGTLLATAAGALAGLVTAILNVRFKILHLLASILTMIALYSINLRIMGRPNVALLGEATVLTPLDGLGLPALWVRPLVLLLVAAAGAAFLARFLLSEVGLAMRATGVNPRMAEAQGIRVAAATCLGMALSNALVALAGALFAQAYGFADVTLGTGTIVVGLAAVIVGETLLPRPTVVAAAVACLVGSVVYRLAVALALEADFLGLQASDLNLVTALLVGGALVLPATRARLLARLAAPAR